MRTRLTSNFLTAVSVCLLASPVFAQSFSVRSCPQSIRPGATTVVVTEVNPPPILVTPVGTLPSAPSIQVIQSLTLTPGGVTVTLGVPASQVPTAAQIAGDFSGSSLPLCDPVTGAAFPNNQIPASRIGNLLVLTAIAQADAPLGLRDATLTALGGLTFQAFGVFEVSATGNPNAYQLTDRGAFSRATSGESAAAVLGYARVRGNSGSSAPAGLAIFGLRQNNILVSEAGVPASVPVTSGRIYAESNTTVNTGLALANGGALAAAVTFYFTSEAGQETGRGTISIPAGGQIAAFLNESPFNGVVPIAGTFTFTSSSPLAAVALRGLSNERGEFLITTMPVSPIGQAAGAQVLLPQFVDGGGWSTQFILVNPFDEPIQGSFQMRGQGIPASPVDIQINLNGQTGSTFNYAIPARASQRFRTAGTDAGVRVGSIVVTPQNPARTPTGLAVFSLKPSGITVAEAGVPGVPGPQSTYRMYVETSGDFAGSATGSIQTGVALTSTAATPTVITFEVTTLSGAPTGLTGTVTIPPLGQVAAFLNQIAGLEQLPAQFQGVVRLRAPAGSLGFAATGLRGRYNERGDFLITTIPIAAESATPSTTEPLFPHFVDGGGYTTQFVLFNAVAGQAPAGTLLFFRQDGQSLNLTLR